MRRLSARVGLALSPVGSGLVDADDPLRRKNHDPRGVPVPYDTCRNLQRELTGHLGVESVLRRLVVEE